MSNSNYDMLKALRKSAGQMPAQQSPAVPPATPATPTAGVQVGAQQMPMSLTKDPVGGNLESQGGDMGMGTVAGAKQTEGEDAIARLEEMESGQNDANQQAIDQATQQAQMDSQGAIQAEQMKAQQATFQAQQVAAQKEQAAHDKARADQDKMQQGFQAEQMKSQQDMAKKEMEFHKDKMEMEAKLNIAEAQNQSIQKQMAQVQSEAPNGVSPMIISKSQKLMQQAQKLARLEERSKRDDVVVKNRAFDKAIKSAVDFNASAASKKPTIGPASITEGPEATVGDGVNKPTSTNMPAARQAPAMPPVPNPREKLSWGNSYTGTTSNDKNFNLNVNSKFWENPMDTTHDARYYDNRSLQSRLLKGLGYEGSEHEKLHRSEGYRPPMKPWIAPSDNAAGNNWMGNTLKNVAHNVYHGSGFENARYNTFRAAGAGIDGARNQLMQHVAAPIIQGANNYSDGVSGVFKNIRKDPYKTWDSMKTGYKGIAGIAEGAAGMTFSDGIIPDKWSGYDKYRERDLAGQRRGMELGVKANPYTDTHKYNKEYSQKRNEYYSKIPGMAGFNPDTSSGNTYGSPHAPSTTNAQTLQRTGNLHNNAWSGGTNQVSPLMNFAAPFATPSPQRYAQGWQGRPVSPLGNAFQGSVAGLYNDNGFR